MKFINSTGNSIWLADIDTNIPFEGDEIQELSTKDVLKSHSFQSLVAGGHIEIVEIENARIEKNLLRLQQEAKEKQDDSEEETLMPSGDTVEVAIRGHFYEAGGYPKVNRSLALGLNALGAKVEIRPVSTSKNDLNEIEVKQLAPLKRKLGREAIVIDSIIPTFSHVSSSKTYRILYTTIEASSVPDQIVDACNMYNEVWVTSDFCKDVLEKSGVTRDILVMPNPINTSLYHDDYEPYEFKPELNSFVFLSIFGWSYRKGYDALLKAYLQEFTGDDDVSLLIMSRYQYSQKRSGVIKDAIDKYLKEYGGDNPPHIARCSRVIPEYEMPRIYGAGDAFVLPSRGEGFGMPYCEASLCGLPCIATNHSGHTMFLNDQNSRLVDIDNISKVMPNTMHVHYWDGQLFPELKSKTFISDLSESMRDVYNNISSYQKKNENLQEWIADNCSVKVSVGRIKKRLDEIWDMTKDRRK